MAIVGGSKVSSKLTILKSLADKQDQLIVGGGIANTFLLASGSASAILAEPDPGQAKPRRSWTSLKARGAEGAICRPTWWWPTKGLGPGPRQQDLRR